MAAPLVGALNTGEWENLLFSTEIAFYKFILPRDTMRKRNLCCRPVSDRLSVTLVDCIQTAEDIITFLSRPDSHIILVF